MTKTLAAVAVAAALAAGCGGSTSSAEPPALSDGSTCGDAVAALMGWAESQPVPSTAPGGPDASDLWDDDDYLTAPCGDDDTAAFNEIRAYANEREIGSEACNGSFQMAVWSSVEAAMADPESVSTTPDDDWIESAVAGCRNLAEVIAASVSTFGSIVDAFSDGFAAEPGEDALAAGTEDVPTPALPTLPSPTTAGQPDKGSYTTPGHWQMPLGNDEMTLQIVGLGWQTDESAYNDFDEELCAEYDIWSDDGCEVREGKGVLVLRYDVARLSGEPDSFYFGHKLAMDNGLVVDGSDLHCAGSETVELAPGGDPQPHETCFVVDTAEIGDQAMIGLGLGFWGEAYWVQVPVTGAS